MTATHDRRKKLIARQVFVLDNITLRLAGEDDIAAITKIYNQGIEDRVATLETRLRTVEEMEEWFVNRAFQYKVAVVQDESRHVKGWASLNPFTARCCYSGVADLSIYIARDSRGKGFGTVLLDYIIETARNQGFHKIVLNAFEFNEAGLRLYRSHGFREVGVYREHGILDGRFINVVIMEKILEEEE